jgi:hypothetical protein
MYTSAPVALPFHRRANTTSEMYITYTLFKPNRDHIIRAMARSIHYAIGVHTDQLSLPGLDPSLDLHFEIFNEKKHPLTLKKRNFKMVPNLEEIVVYIKYWFFKQVLSPQVGIMAIHYIDQLIHKNGLLMNAENWRRVLLSALLVADKLWEEDIVCNADYITDNYPLLTVEELNALERKFLSLLDFKLLLKASVYAEYYFALRSISGSECFPSKALDKKTAKLMDFKSISHPKRKRSYSVDTTEKKEKPEETSALSFEQFTSSRFIA